MTHTLHTQQSILAILALRERERDVQKEIKLNGVMQSTLLQMLTTFSVTGLAPTTCRGVDLVSTGVKQSAAASTAVTRRWRVTRESLSIHRQHPRLAFKNQLSNKNVEEEEVEEEEVEEEEL